MKLLLFKVKNIRLFPFSEDQYEKTGLAISFLLLVPSIAVLIQSFHWHFMVDSPILQYISFLILHGKVPYKDIFDFNLPGTFLLHILGIKLFGAGDAGFRLFDLFNLLIISLSIYLLLKKYNKISIILGILIYVNIHLAGGEYAMGQRDFLMLPYLGMGTFFSYLAISNSKPLYLFITGLLLGFCCTIKPTPLLLAFFFFLLFFFYHKKEMRKNISAASLMLVGLIICPLLIMGWLIKSGGFAQFIAIFFKFLPIHLSSLKRSPFILLNEIILSPLHIIYTIIFISLIFSPMLYLKLTSDKPRRITYSLLICGIIYGLIHYWFQGKGWPYHLYPLFFFSIIFCCLIIGDLFEIENTLLKKFSASSIIILTFFISVLTMKTFFHQPNELNEYVHGIEKNSKIVALGERDISSLIKPGEKVQVFDSGGEGLNILYRLKLYQPTRFEQEVNFTWGPPVGSSPYLQKLWKEFMTGLKNDPPKCIAVFNSSEIFKKEICNGNLFPDLCSFITNNYTLIIIRNDYKIYVRKG